MDKTSTDGELIDNTVAGNVDDLRRDLLIKDATIEKMLADISSLKQQLQKQQTHEPPAKIPIPDFSGGGLGATFSNDNLGAIPKKQTKVTQSNKEVVSNTDQPLINQTVTKVPTNDPKMTSYARQITKNAENIDNTIIGEMISPFVSQPLLQDDQETPLLTAKISDGGDLLDFQSETPMMGAFVQLHRMIYELSRGETGNVRNTLETQPMAYLQTMLKDHSEHQLFLKQQAEAQQTFMNASNSHDFIELPTLGDQMPSGKIIKDFCRVFGDNIKFSGDPRHDERQPASMLIYTLIDYAETHSLSSKGCYQLLRPMLSGRLLSHMVSADRIGTHFAAYFQNLQTILKVKYNENDIRQEIANLKVTLPTNLTHTLMQVNSLNQRLNQGRGGIRSLQSCHSWNSNRLF
jgi:hypothetical protein